VDTSDIVEIYQIMALYGHAVDADHADFFPLVFAPDAVVDATGMGGPMMEGLAAITAFFVGGRQYKLPPHTFTNPYVYEKDGEVRGLGKWFTASGENRPMMGGDYNDVFVKTADGWRFKYRKLILRK
jgi:hypothetical protein